MVITSVQYSSIKHRYRFGFIKQDVSLMTQKYMFCIQNVFEENLHIMIMSILRELVVQVTTINSVQNIRFANNETLRM